MDNAFKYMMANGIATFSSYPYVAADKSCAKSSKPRSSVKVTGFKDVAVSETALQQAVGKFSNYITWFLSVINWFNPKFYNFYNELCFHFLVNHLKKSFLIQFSKLQFPDLLNVKLK